MSSQINPNTINQSYPVAGADNNSQGFRDNFTAIKNNFTVTAREINDIMNKVVVKSPLTYGPSSTNTNNDLGGSSVNNVVLVNDRLSVVNLGTITTSGGVAVDFSAGGYQYLTLDNTSNVSQLTFTNVPATGFAEMRLSITTLGTGHTLQLDASKTYVFTTHALNYSPYSKVLTFPAAGIYDYVFSTRDGGSTWAVTEIQNVTTPVLSTNVYTTSSSFSTVTGLTFVAQAGRRYKFSALLPISHTDSANTHSFAVGFNSGNCVYTVEQQTTATSAFSVSTATSSNTGGTVTSGQASTVRMARISGVFQDGANTVPVSVSFKTSGGNLTVVAGACLTYEIVA
jgi:hypothetical protein